MWRLPGWVRNPARQEARIPPAGDQKPAADAKARGQGAWARAAECKAYPVCPANDANVVLGFTGNGCGAAPIGGSATGQAPRYSEGTRSPNSASRPPTSPVRERSPKSSRRAPDRCPISRTVYRTASAGRPPPPRSHEGDETWKETMTRVQNASRERRSFCARVPSPPPSSPGSTG
jgi:hypothetical protein